jgi:hypothetical protein
MRGCIEMDYKNGIQSIGSLLAAILTHFDVDWGMVYHPMPTIPLYNPAFAQPAVAERSTPCLTHAAYQQKEGTQ